MSRCRNAVWLLLCYALIGPLFWGCATSKKDPSKQEQEKREAEKRRKEWFKNADGKPVSEQRSIEHELLTEEPSALSDRKKPENPYPIYTDREKTEEPPVAPPEERFDGREKIKAEFDFNGAAVTDVIPVFAELLKFNYLLDGKLNGTVTLSLKDELTRRQLWELLRQVMQTSNIYLTKQDNMIHFRPVEAIAQAAAGDGVSSDAEVALFRLKNIGAKETASQIGQFLSPGLKPVELEERNLLLVVDTKENLRKVRQIVAQLDRPLRQGWAKMVIPCRNIDASRLAKEAADVLPVLGFPVALNSDKPRPEEIQLTTVERLQIIVASAANYEALEELGRWINILDQSETGDQERMFIYNILNGNAEELVKALAVMFPVEGETLTASTGSSGSSSSSGSGELFSSSASASTSQTTTQSGSVKSAAKTGSKEEGPANLFEVPVKVFADAVNNRLIIRTKPRTYTMIKALLGKIDTIPPQVLFQVLVVDVSLNDSVKFGVEFMMKGGSGNVTTQGGTNFSGLTPGSGQNSQSGGKFWIYNPKNPDQKFGYINALAGKTNVKVISSPQVLIASNNEAKISVGSKVPIVNSEITNTQSIITNNSDSSTNLVRNIQYQDTGVILKITPKVTRGGRIAIKLAQTVSEADSNTVSDIDSPVIKEQIIETAMSLRDGQTIICGGIIKEKSTDNLSTLPGIGGIPFLRRLFGDTDISTDRTEMMILITGYIVSEDSHLEELVKRYEQAVDALIDFHVPAGQRKRKIDQNKGLVESWFIE
ncbi:secretin N-terminal domain-containing protein [Victivallis vadensis]|uniref:secretin N-terminal domain-containing protein n=1 Tax=Victivallis vadensis TaxID=172901 RepID=UPI00266C87F3|nr:secretin N-terminal domain-containing protein [Victivallis vadensis]